MAKTTEVPGKGGDTNQAPKEAKPTGKVSQEASNYRESEAGRSCGICSNFEAPNMCKVVEGEVDPEHVSDMFMPLKGEAAMRQTDPMELM